MTVKDLSKLYNLNREIEQEQQRLDELDIEIKRDEARLQRLTLRATSATGSNYDGMPKSPSFENRAEAGIVELLDLQTLISQKKELRIECATIIQGKLLTCLAERNRLERYIASIPDSLNRQIFTFRFINGLTWEQVAASIGGRNTADSVKKRCYRYLDETNPDKD